MAHKRASMADVARIAGVSAQTVSRVVNASPRVDPATRARVEEAMARSGYRIHRAARALRTGRSGTIGVVVSTLSTVGNSLMLEAVTDAAAARHRRAVVPPAGRGRRGAGASQRAGRRRPRRHQRGVRARAVRDLPTALRLVVVDSPPDDRFAGVETDHAGGAAAATAHLLAHGHRTVAHIAGPESS
ncbi:LacI family DNA-binding transcriptional regulator [Microbacterium hominis]|uniref:LacI family DNA-binding transcriptional regulator n=1 Tax=Microbacterium hominis TaxID=162426 RepID=UPI000AFA93B4|nr:LacI family DNA-binding transcriptional regulator [Microbacterium hominis]